MVPGQVIRRTPNKAMVSRPGRLPVAVRSGHLVRTMLCAESPPAPTGGNPLARNPGPPKRAFTDSGGGLHCAHHRSLPNPIERPQQGTAAPIPLPNNAANRQITWPRRAPKPENYVVRQTARKRRVNKHAAHTCPAGRLGNGERQLDDPRSFLGNTNTTELAQELREAQSRGQKGPYWHHSIFGDPWPQELRSATQGRVARPEGHVGRRIPGGEGSIIEAEKAATAGQRHVPSYFNLCAATTGRHSEFGTLKDSARAKPRKKVTLRGPNHRRRPGNRRAPLHGTGP